MLGDNKRTIAHGIVDQVYPERHSARVVFNDKDNLTSAEYPIITGFTNGNKSYMMPQIGESVICICETEDDISGSGYIIGAIYDDKNPPKVSDINKTRIDFADGSFIEFDKSTGNLTINCTGEIKINGKKIYLN